MIYDKLSAHYYSFLLPAEASQKEQAYLNTRSTKCSSSLSVSQYLWLYFSSKYTNTHCCNSSTLIQMPVKRGHLKRECFKNKMCMCLWFDSLKIVLKTLLDGEKNPLQINSSYWMSTLLSTVFILLSVYLVFPSVAHRLIVLFLTLWASFTTCIYYFLLYCLYFVCGLFDSL